LPEKIRSFNPNIVDGYRVTKEIKEREECENEEERQIISL
jgi:hypothetical protein